MSLKDGYIEDVVRYNIDYLIGEGYTENEAIALAINKARNDYKSMHGDSTQFPRHLTPGMAVEWYNTGLPDGLEGHKEIAATEEELGHIKVGDNLTISEDGKLDAASGMETHGNEYHNPDYLAETDTTKQPRFRNITINENYISEEAFTYYGFNGTHKFFMNYDGDYNFNTDDSNRHLKFRCNTGPVLEVGSSAITIDGEEIGAGGGGMETHGNEYHEPDYIPDSEKGANNGVATLDSGGDVPASQLGNVEGGEGGTEIHIDSDPDPDPDDYSEGDIVLAPMESGTGAQGFWIRFPDGTQICYGTGLVLSYDSMSRLETTWTYPQSFMTGTVPSISFTLGNPSISAGGSKITCNQIRFSHNNSSARLQVRSLEWDFVDGDTVEAYPIAIGRWK